MADFKTRLLTEPNRTIQYFVSINSLPRHY